MELVEVLSFIVTLLLSQPTVTVASTFGQKNDKWKGGKAFCLKRNLSTKDIGVAHRSLPCGTRLLIGSPRTGRLVVGVVMDAGPYGALTRDGKWVLKRYKKDPGKWRGGLDLSEGTRRLLKHNGFEPVVYYVLPNGYK